MTGLTPTEFFHIAVPLFLLLVVIYVVRRMTSDLRPIFVNIVGGIANNAQGNAMVYAMAFMFGLTASCSSFIDVFKDLSRDQFLAMSWHQYMVCWVKVFNPFAIAIIAYFTKAPMTGTEMRQAGHTPAPKTPPPVAPVVPPASKPPP